MGVVIVGQKGAIARVRGIRTRMQNPSPRMWQGVGRQISQEVRMQFRTRGRHFGTMWRNLTPEYAERKRASGFRGGILVASGAMRDTFTGRPMDIEQYMGQSARFGSSNQKAVWHHNGTHRNGKQVNPARPILVVTHRMTGEIADVVRRYVARGTT